MTGGENSPARGVTPPRPDLRALRRVAVLAAAVCVLCVPAGAALGGVVRGYPHSHRCAGFRLTTDGYVVRYRVTVLRGTVRCSSARRVLRDFLRGKGTLHGPPGGPAYKQSWTLDGGWSCGHGAGGGACIRGGRNFKIARQYIEADAIP